MGLSYQEKSIWGSLVATVLVYGYYLATPERHLALALIGMTVIQIAFQIVIAITNRVEKPDERDRLIEARGEKIAHRLLISGVLAAMVWPESRWLLAALVVSECAGWIVQLYLYRRGV